VRVALAVDLNFAKRHESGFHVRSSSLESAK
jgi:hypothetical protein